MIDTQVEGMAAIVLLGSEWWGTLSAWCEASRARRSCLVLSVMRPGAAAAPWLGPLDQLGHVDEGSADGMIPSLSDARVCRNDAKHTIAHLNAETRCKLSVRSRVTLHIWAARHTQKFSLSS